MDTSLPAAPRGSHSTARKPLHARRPGRRGQAACAPAPPAHAPAARAQVAAGSADRMVYIWDAATRALLYQLPGHAGSVNEAAFHPSEPIIASAGSDKQVFLGELVL